MNNENAFLTKVESYKKMLFYFYIKMKQNNDRINIYISRISKPEFEEGVLQSKQNDFFQLPINEKKLIKNNADECKKCKFYTICLKTNEKSDLVQIQAGIMTINEIIKNKNCKYNELNKDEKDFKILQIKEYIHIKGSDLIKGSD